MKTFVTKNITKETIKHLIRTMSIESGVKRVVFGNSLYVDGTYSPDSKTIFIDKTLNKKDTLCAFFHELAHHVAIKNKKWMVYHRNPSTHLLSAKKKFYIENSIDKLANKLWRKYVAKNVWGNYKYGYPIMNKNYMVKVLG